MASERVKVRLASCGSVRVGVRKAGVVPASIGERVHITHYDDVPTYDGAYSFTPSAVAQTVEISGLKATQDITINPIPSNYGRIEFDGSTLSVI